MYAITVTGLYTYPIKSCGGISHDTVSLTARGFQYDRQWMVVRDDERHAGMFVTQREFPKMALIQTRIDADCLHISAPDMSDTAVMLKQKHAADREVVIWKDTVRAVNEGDQLAAWFSAYLGAPLRLVRFDDAGNRSVSMKYTDQPSQTGFSDGYPILIANESSLGDLNARLESRGKPPVLMNRFRPNIVVSGADAWAEDYWKWVTIGGIRFEIPKPCARCPITTVDQATGTIPVKGEPLATLETFRRGSGDVSGVIFGQNVIHRGMGDVKLHETVKIKGEENLDA